MFRPRNGVTKSSYRAGGVVRIKRTYPDNWAVLRVKVLERDSYRCRKCGANLRGVFYREVHHILPLSKGGSNHMSNLISLCSKCHKNQH